MKLRALAVVIVLVLVGAACADVTSDAATINGEAISHSDLDDVLGEVQSELNAAEDPSLAEFQLAGGSMDSAVAAQVLTFLVQTELLDQLMAEQGISLSEQDINEFLPAPEVGSGLESFDQIQAELLARLSVVDRADADAALAAADISIDPQYGIWEQGQVIPNSLRG